jgi:hypothetical protein
MKAGSIDMDKLLLPITNAVIKALRKEKNGYLNIKALINGFPVEIKRTLGFEKNIKTKDFTAKEALNRLAPHMDKTVLVYPKGNLIYLSLDSKDSMILRKLQQVKSFPTFKMLRKNVAPLLNDDFTLVLNDLLLSGKVRCTFKGENPVLSISEQVSTQPSKPVDLIEDEFVNPEMERGDESELFQAALSTIGKGRRMVYLYMIRRNLNWSRERFDALIRKLRADYRIQLHGGDPSVMTEDQVRDSFMDERGILHISVSWRDK